MLRRTFLMLAILGCRDVTRDVGGDFGDASMTRRKFRPIKRRAVMRTKTPRVMAARPVPPDPTLATELGAELLHWWEIPDDEDPSYIDVDVASPPLYPGYAVQTLYDRVGGAHAVASGAGLGPWYFGSGGPNGGPMMMVGASQKLTATISLPAGHRCALYVVGAMALVAGVRTLMKLFRTTGSADCVSITRLATHNWRYVCSFSGGGQIKDVANLHNDWMLYSPVVPFASGALIQTDGETTSPSWTGGGSLIAADRVYFGSNNTTGEGLIKAAWIVHDVTAEKHAISVAYGRSLVC